MILNKKGFMMLPLAALLFATGCNKGISYDDAVKFVKENYTSTEGKTPKSAVLEFSGWGANDASKEAVRSFAKEVGVEELDANLHYKETVTPTETFYPLTEKELPKSGDVELFEYTYSTKGKELTISAYGKLEVTGSFVEQQGYQNYNSEGYQTKQYAKMTTKAGELDYWYSMETTLEY